MGLCKTHIVGAIEVGITYHTGSLVKNKKMSIDETLDFIAVYMYRVQSIIYVLHTYIILQIFTKYLYFCMPMYIRIICMTYKGRKRPKMTFRHGDPSCLWKDLYLNISRSQDLNVCPLSRHPREKNEKMLETTVVMLTRFINVYFYILRFLLYTFFSCAGRTTAKSFCPTGS